MSLVFVLGGGYTKLSGLNPHPPFCVYAVDTFDTG